MAKRKRTAPRSAATRPPRLPLQPAGSTVVKDAQLVAVRTPAAIDAAMHAQGMDQTVRFGPGTPIRPYEGYSQEPRTTDYPVGVNISLATRSSWGRMSFDTIKALIDAYDVARMCINHKIDELRSMEPMFLPIDGKAGQSPAVDEAIDAARVALEFPDGQLPYDEWLSLLLENALRYDATPLYHRRNMAGEVIGLEVIDGTTIVPYVDEHGRIPRPPAPADYQLIHGSPWNAYTTDDISYRRFRPQADPYGLPAMEQLLLTANTDLRFQWHFLQMFTDGSVPGGFIELPPDISSPDQVAEWQDYWDSMILGDQAKLHQLIAVPNGTKIQTGRPDSFDSAFPEYLMTRTCAAFGVTPQDLGLVKDVNRANGETQIDIQFRVNTLPWVNWIQGILSRYLRRGLGLPVKVQLDTGRDKEDRLAEAQAWQVYVNSGMASPDEGRQELLGLPVDNDRPVPRFIMTSRQGPVPLSSLMGIAGPIDPETAAPLDNVPLDLTPFEGVPGVAPDKLPGNPEFKRAPLDPDEPRFPQLEKPIPGTEVVNPPAGPVAKDGATAGVTSGTGIAGTPLAAVVETKPAEDYAEVAKSAELASYARFVRARRKAGRWRDFQFTTVDEVTAHRLNDHGRAHVRKAEGQFVAAGLAVRAKDTGRVLMLQRALDANDDAAGRWEFPGGHIEDGESPLDAAVREWCEETGLALPEGERTGGWSSNDGVYRGFVWAIGSESELELGDRTHFVNPDDPDGDCVEALAWWEPWQLTGNPAVRGELAADLGVVQRALLGAALAVDLVDGVVKGDAGPKG